MPKDVQIDVHFATIAAMSKMGSQAAVEQAMTSEGWSTDTSLTRNNDKKWDCNNRIQFLELLFVQLCHNRPAVKSCPNGIKRLTDSSELDAQNVSPHQKTKRKGKPHLKVVCLPGPLSCNVAQCRCEIAAE